MKIVIDIPKELRKDILEDGVLYADYEPVLRDAIKNGTPLPEKHGRLINADELRYKVSGSDYAYEMTYEVDTAPTILEAEGK